MFMKVSRSALLFAILAGCSRTPSPSTAASPAQEPLTLSALAGQYNLVAVDGLGLPYKLPSADRPIASGSLTIGSNGTFRLETVYDQPGQPAGSAEFSGACYPEGDQLKMAWDGGGLTNITVRADTLVLKREGASYSYVRPR
jgi:hypothetical protein